MKILLVEDDQRTADFVIKGLNQESFCVDHAINGEDGLHLATSEQYDVAVVDIMLPRLDGLSLIKELRIRRNFLPVIVLSAKNTVYDRVKGLESGGDDYLVKPFAFSELVARIHALIRRSNKNDNSVVFQVGELTLDLLRKKVFANVKEIFLQPKELILLEYLIRNQGKVVSKTMIMENVWDYNFDPQTNVVEAKISKLRSKLTDVCEKNYIHTVKGLGYVCEDRN
ncbi:response regulator transcription factor [bacterium]|nr:response regulator transcription factor [bacterium]